MFVLPGRYTKKNHSFWSLKFTEKNTGSPDGSLKRLTGIGEVLVEGSRPVPYSRRSASAGETWIRLKKGAGNVTVSHFTVRRVALGISAAEGGNRNLYLSDLHFVDTRQNIWLVGHPECKSAEVCGVAPEEVTSNIVIDQTSGLRYSKRHIRLTAVHHVDILNSYADSGYLDGDFAAGFDVEGPAHDILFYNSISMRNKYSKSKYWNGDGFKSEKNTSAIRWIRCRAYGNADGGFDIKTPHAYLENIIASGNKRNIRIWSLKSNSLINILASHSKNKGGVGADAGIWAHGVFTCERCSVKGNGVQCLLEGPAGPGKAIFRNSIVSAGSRKGSKVEAGENAGRAEFINSRVTRGIPSDEKPAETPDLGFSSELFRGRKLQAQEKTAGNELYALIAGSDQKQNSTR